MNKLRIILVGAGGARAQTWLKIIKASADFDLVGLCDRDEKALQNVATEFPGTETGVVLEDVANVGADAVLLCTPPDTRAVDIAFCCKKRLHVLAEKPLSDSVSEAEGFVEMAEQAGIHLIVGLNFRYLTVTQEMRKLFQARTVGVPEFARFTYERWRDGSLPHLNSYPLTMSQPMLWEQSIHHFDLMRFVYASEPVRVYARTFNPSWTMYADDTNVSAIIDFDNGLSVSYQGTWQGNWSVMGFEWRTECTEGIVVQNEMFGDLGYAARSSNDLTGVSMTADEPWITDATRLFAAFADTLLGRAAPQCTGRDHLQSLKILQACILSSERAQAIEMLELEESTSTAA